jgi:predicted transcriptional regulator
MSSHETRENTPEETTASESDPTRALTRHKAGEALAKAGFGDVQVLSHEQADQVLTPARRAIIDTLATHDVSSLRDLATHLDRDPGNLSRDMKVLVAENVIRYEEDGKAKRPELKHDTIITEPLVATDDPLPESVSST